MRRGIGGPIPMSRRWFGVWRRAGSRPKKGWRRSPLLPRPHPEIGSTASPLSSAACLEETDRERADLIERLRQMGHRQRELADLVARLGDELKSVPPEGADQRVDLQQRHDFTARNFEEIQRTIRYACETPVALDARLGAWARALQQAASAAAPG